MGVGSSGRDVHVFTHGDVLSVHTETFFNLHTGAFRIYTRGPGFNKIYMRGVISSPSIGSAHVGLLSRSWYMHKNINFSFAT